ncbi:MAG TPA: IS481 family transposase [Acidimicrobiales bacterium]|nr:IS481 family transposase [Acidimicrobiales bacterium]
MHGNARLTHKGRQLVVERMLAGTPAATVARQMSVSRATVYKWWDRYHFDPDGQWWRDRSSRPKSCPTRTRRRTERRILSLRRNKKLGPARIAARLELPASTVHAVLVRAGASRLGWMDRPTGTVVRRYEHDRPGDLVHVDIKKLGKIPPGGGWRAHGRSTAMVSAKAKRPKIGYCYVHSAVDDHSRLAYSEIHDDETAATACGFWVNARAFFESHGIRVKAVLTDNGSSYRGLDWIKEVVAGGAQPRRTRPYRPQTNGKVERFNRTLLEEWAYARTYSSEAERRRRLDTWLHTYNHHRCHTALKGQPPISRVDNLPGHYS